MDRATVANIVAEAIKSAISELPTKDHMKDLLTTLEVKINETICEQIQKATGPLHAKIEQLELKHNVYEAHFAAMENRLNVLEQRSDDAEQYSRRSCLRIYGIPLPKRSQENASNCMEKVKKVFKEINVVVPDDAIDRAHRIGKKVKDSDTGEVGQAMIVKFLSWKHRSSVYRSRKETDDKRISLDLTTKRAKLLGFAKEKAKDYHQIEFVFADINCRIGLKTVEGNFLFFNNEYELKDILEGMS